MLILHSVNRVLCTLCKLHSASTEQCSQFIVLIVHNFKKVLFTLARVYLHNFKKVHISTVRGVLHKFMKVHIVHIFQCNAWLHSEQLAGRTFCIEDNLHSGRFRSRYLPPWVFVTMGAHTSNLSFLLHGQNFWRIKFTPKNANFSR